ncbi:hypothetical protein [Halorussus caseinilyticus]|uniref:Uncharacterized protein n=1 Tax=Halorussus caseinilyticus TaxID=3034025 RepID=A0ABD5WPG2_9EURY|nr:hypothetical protein [Halorussus sp. DT72]
MNAPRSRRSVVGSAATTLAVGLAGCTDESPENVESVHVSNWHAEPHIVSVAVSVDGERRVSRTVDVPSVTERDDATVPGQVTIDETFPGPGYVGKRTYEVTAALDGGTPTTESTTTGEGFDSIGVRVGEDAALTVGFADAV